MTSSNGNIFRVTGPLCGEFTGPGEFPAQRPVTRSFDVFFDLSLNKRLSKQSWGWWFETPSGSLWHHCNDTSNGDVLCVSSVLAKNCWKNSKFVVNLSLMWCQCIGIYGASPDAHTRFRAWLCFAVVMYRLAPFWPISSNITSHIEAETKCPPFCRRHFQMHFREWNVWISIKNSPRFGLINNIPTLVQIMARADQATSH